MVKIIEQKYKKIGGLVFLAILVIVFNYDLNAADCKIRVALQNDLLREDLNSINLINDVMVIGGFALTARRNVSFKDFINAPQSLINANFKKYLTAKKVKLDIAKVSFLVLNIEKPVSIERLFVNVSDHQERHEFIQAYKRRITAVKKFLPNKKLGLFGIPSVSADPKYSGILKRTNITAAYNYAGQQGIFDQIDVIFPTLYMRWNRGEQSQKFINDNLLNTIKEAVVLRDSYVKEKPVIPFLSIKLFNGRSASHNKCIPVIDSSKLLNTIVNFGKRSVVYWLGKAQSMDDKNWCVPRNYFTDLQSASREFCSFH